MITEYYKPIPRHSNYLISTDGDIINTKTKKNVSHSIVNGRNRVTLNGKTEYVATLILETFIRPKENGEYVLHRDLNLLNDNLYNLEWQVRGLDYEKRYPNPSVYPGREGISKKILINEINKTFPSLRKCAKFIGGHSSGIRACLDNKIKTYKGYTYTLLDD